MRRPHIWTRKWPSPDTESAVTLRTSYPPDLWAINLFVNHPVYDIVVSSVPKGLTQRPMLNRIYQVVQGQTGSEWARICPDVWVSWTPEQTFNHPIKLPLPRKELPHLTVLLGSTLSGLWDLSGPPAIFLLPTSCLSTMPGYATILLNLCVNLSQVQLRFCGHGGHTPQKVQYVLQNVKISLCDLVPSRKSPCFKGEGKRKTFIHLTVSCRHILGSHSIQINTPSEIAVEL